MKENAAKKRPDEEVALKQAAENLGNGPDLFYVNRNALRALEGNLLYGLSHIQAIIDEYFVVVGEFPIMEEVESWFGKGRSDFLVPNKEVIRAEILDKLIDKHREQYPTMLVDVERIILPPLDKLFELCGQIIFVPAIEFKEAFYFQCYSIIVGKVELLPFEVELTKNSWRQTAITAEEKERLQQVRKICELMGTLKIMNHSRFDVPGLLFWDSESGVYSAREDYVKGFIK